MQRQRTGPNPGPKGGLSLWGMIGANTDVGAFCEGLKPFWAALLAGVEGGPHGFERIVVLAEVEQSEAATAYQIGWDDNESKSRRLTIKQCPNLPFAWGQY